MWCVLCECSVCRGVSVVCSVSCASAVCGVSCVSAVCGVSCVSAVCVEV